MDTTTGTAAALHDAYAADYDAQVLAFECYLAEALFGLCYAFIQPGQRLLDLGIGSGLSAAPFARAGLRVWGVDFSAAMLDLCRAKGIAEDLRQHDLQAVPWSYPAEAFDHAICCGVFHFIPDLAAILAETARVVRPGGLFAFTTKWPGAAAGEGAYEQAAAGELLVYAHAPAHVESILERQGFPPLRTLRCFAGEDVFALWVCRRE